MDFIVVCPNCQELVLIQEINCSIFRHGAYKNGQQINPHATKEECDMLVEKGLIDGCGYPFRLVKIEDHYAAVKSDYV